MDKAELVNKLAISADLAKIAAGKTLKSVVDVILKRWQIVNYPALKDGACESKFLC
jgi:nucleoid DNA-binding protein